MVLLRKKADHNLKDIAGHTPLHIAARNGLVGLLDAAAKTIKKNHFCFFDEFHQKFSNQSFVIVY